MFKRYDNINHKEITMTDEKNSKNHLIDDSGIHKDFKPKQITIFVTLCRLVTVVLIVLGALALFVGS